MLPLLEVLLLPVKMLVYAYHSSFDWKVSKCQFVLVWKLTLKMMVLFRYERE